MPDTKREQVLSVRDLDITFKTTAGPVHAIRGVNIDLYKGETVALVGESGSGKSVTMKAAMGGSISEELALYYANLANLLKYALIVVSAAPLLIIYPFLQKYFDKGVMLGSIKG